MRFGLAALVISVLLGGLAAAKPQTASGLSNCTASELVPALREVSVNQGVGSYARRVRGKETLVKFFLSNPTTCVVTSTQSLNVTGATLTVNNTVQTFTGIAPFQSFAAAPAVSAALSNNSAADPIFAVPAANLVPALANPDTDTFTPTFTATVTYSRKSGRHATAGLTATYSNTTAVTFERRTRALRVLVIPMGDGSTGVLANTQYTPGDQTSTQNAFSALARIFPPPARPAAWVFTRRHPLRDQSRGDAESESGPRRLRREQQVLRRCRELRRDQGATRTVPAVVERKPVERRQAGRPGARGSRRGHQRRRRLGLRLRRRHGVRRLAGGMGARDLW